MKQAIYTPLTKPNIKKQKDTQIDKVDISLTRDDDVVRLYQPSTKDPIIIENDLESTIEPTIEPTIEQPITDAEFTLPEISDDADWNFKNIMEPVINLLRSRGHNINVSSGVRKGAKTSSGKTSRHSLGLAADLTTDDFNKLINDIKGDAELQSMLDRFGIMLYDETTPEALNRTKGTGKHIHMSINPKDRGYEFAGMESARLWKPQISLAKRGIKVPDLKRFYKEDPQGDENKVLTINSLGVDESNPYITPGWDYMDGLPNK